MINDKVQMNASCIWSNHVIPSSELSKMTKNDPFYSDVPLYLLVWMSESLAQVDTRSPKVWQGHENLAWCVCERDDVELSEDWYQSMP